VILRLYKRYFVLTTYGF